MASITFIIKILPTELVSTVINITNNAIYSPMPTDTKTHSNKKPFVTANTAQPADPDLIQPKNSTKFPSQLMSSPANTNEDD